VRHTEPQHNPASPEYDGWRIIAIRVLNMTGQRHRMTVGDAKTSTEAAWQTPWIEVGDNQDYSGPDLHTYIDGAPNIYMTEAGHPFQVECF
jgi:hypothetical protein